MKKIKLKYKEALLYLNEHPELSFTKIGEMFGCERHTLKKLFDEKINWDNVLYTEGEELLLFTDNEKQAIIAYEENILTVLEIAELYGVSKSTMSRWVTRFNLTQRGPKRKYTLNERKFYTIETEEDAYWLGFITADGYVNEERGFLNVKLQLQDEEHLIKLKNFLESYDSPIKDDKGGSGQLIKSITFNSKKLVENLVKLNIRQNKSGYEIPQYNLETKLYSAYLRGLIDGDGCLTYGENNYQIDLVGSIELVKFVRDFINKNIVPLNYDYIYQHGTIYRFTCRNQEIVKACYEFLYENANIYLDRKYRIAMSFLHGRDKTEEKTGTA